MIIGNDLRADAADRHSRSELVAEVVQMNPQHVTAAGRELADGGLSPLAVQVVQNIEATPAKARQNGTWRRSRTGKRTLKHCFCHRTAVSHKFIGLR